MGGEGCDCSGELGAWDEGEGGLVLVFSADLEEVEEICACGVDGDCVLVCFGLRSGDIVGELEVGGGVDEGG